MTLACLLSAPGLILSCAAAHLLFFRSVLGAASNTADIEVPDGLKDNIVALDEEDIGAQTGGCLAKGVYYEHDSTPRVIATGPFDCQRLCQINFNCVHFSYWPDGGCLSAGDDAKLHVGSQECEEMRRFSKARTECAGEKVISGPRTCGSEFADLYPGASSGVTEEAELEPWRTKLTEVAKTHGLSSSPLAEEEDEEAADRIKLRADEEHQAETDSSTDKASTPAGSGMNLTLSHEDKLKMGKAEAARRDADVNAFGKSWAAGFLVVMIGGLLMLYFTKCPGCESCARQKSKRRGKTSRETPLQEGYDASLQEDAALSPGDGSPSRWSPKSEMDKQPVATVVERPYGYAAAPQANPMVAFQDPRQTSVPYRQISVSSGQMYAAPLRAPASSGYYVPNKSASVVDEYGRVVAVYPST